jgi:hypothetical protein
MSEKVNRAIPAMLGAALIILCGVPNPEFVAIWSAKVHARTAGVLIMFSLVQRPFRRFRVHRQHPLCRHDDSANQEPGPTLGRGQGLMPLWWPCPWSLALGVQRNADRRFRQPVGCRISRPVRSPDPVPSVPQIRFLLMLLSIFISHVYI